MWNAHARTFGANCIALSALITPRMLTRTRIRARASERACDRYDARFHRDYVSSCTYAKSRAGKSLIGEHEPIVRAIDEAERRCEADESGRFRYKRDFALRANARAALHMCASACVRALTYVGVSLRRGIHAIPCKYEEVNVDFGLQYEVGYVMQALLGGLSRVGSARAVSRWKSRVYHGDTNRPRRCVHRCLNRRGIGH